MPENTQDVEGLYVTGREGYPDRIERLCRWLDENAGWIGRQRKAKIIINMAGKSIEVEIGLGKEKI